MQGHVKYLLACVYHLIAVFLVINNEEVCGCLLRLVHPDAFSYTASILVMPRGRPAKDGGVYHDFEAARDLTTAPHLSYTLNDSGDHVTCTAHDFVPPPAKRRRIGDLEGSHAQWTPVPRDTADDTEFEYPPWTSNWAASGDGPASLDTGVEDEFCEVGHKRSRAGWVRRSM